MQRRALHACSAAHTAWKWMVKTWEIWNLLTSNKRITHRWCAPLTPLTRERGSVYPKFAALVLVLFPMLPNNPDDDLWFKIFSKDVPWSEMPLFAADFANIWFVILILQPPHICNIFSDFYIATFPFQFHPIVTNRLLHVTKRCFSHSSQHLLRATCQKRTWAMNLAILHAKHRQIRCNSQVSWLTCEL